MKVINTDKMSLVELESLAFRIIEKRELADKELRQVSILIQEKRNGHGKVGLEAGRGNPKTETPEQEIEKDN